MKWRQTVQRWPYGDLMFKLDLYRWIGIFFSNRERKNGVSWKKKSISSAKYKNCVSMINKKFNELNWIELECSLSGK